MKPDFSSKLSATYQNLPRLLFTLLRIFIGWHFLYEGLAKLFSPWSSAGYLMESQWLLSGMFHGIAENPGLLQFVDTLTVIGLILVGAGLFLGLFTRVSAGFQRREAGAGGLAASPCPGTAAKRRGVRDRAMAGAPVTR